MFETVAIIHSFEIVCSSIGCTTIASRDIQLVMNKILQNQIVNYFWSYDIMDISHYVNFVVASYGQDIDYGNSYNKIITWTMV